MSKTGLILDQKNVNGVMLTLTVNSKDHSPTARRFTISYKNEEMESSWPKASLFLAVLFNILALCLVRINLIAFLIIFVGFFFLVFFWSTHSVKSESLVVIPGVGIQSSVKYVHGREDKFVPWSNIDDVIIQEVIKLNRVLYYLTVLVINGNQLNQQSKVTKVIPLFKNTKPRLQMLVTIYSELQCILCDARRDKPAMAAGDM